MALYQGSRIAVGRTALFPYNNNTDTEVYEVRTLTCVQSSLPGYLRSCVTHLATDDATAADQVQDIKDVVDSYAQAGYTVVGGDFNQEPVTGTDMLTITMYTGYGGYFDDVDRNSPCQTDGRYNADTHGSGKIDYTFVATSRFRCVGGVVGTVDNFVSDHDTLRGAADYYF